MIRMSNKQDPMTCCLWEIHFKYKKSQAENKWMQNVYVYKQHKMAGVAVLISGKVGSR